MTTEQLKAATVQNVENKRDMLWDSIADGYYETDLEGTLVTANRPFCRMLGYENPQQVIAAKVRLLGAETWGKLRERILTSGEPLTAVDCMISSADHEKRCFEISMALLPDAAGNPAGFHGIVRDVSDTVRGNESLRLYEGLQAELDELRRQYAELSEVEQLKTHMIRVTAHDIRSPLSVISSYLDMLDEDLAQHYNEMDTMYMGAIRQAVARVMQMTSDILTLERLHEYRDVTLMRVQLGTLLERTLDEFTESSRQRQQEMRVSAEPVAAYGDSVELHEAFANLIGNAVKYTPNGGVIEVSLWREGEFALFEVNDSGYGIPENEQALLFQPFHRVKTPETYSIDGTGLGLYLVKKIVERHDGSIYFESVYGKGSRFGIRLPLAK